MKESSVQAFEGLAENRDKQQDYWTLESPKAFLAL
jgi:hypothetical protein